MAQIRPFPSGRPPKAIAARVASVPYDVVDTKEALALAAGNPVSFLHVCRPEIDLPAGDRRSTPTPSTRRGARTSTASTRTGRSSPTRRPASSSTGRRGGAASRTASWPPAAVDDYDADVIKKHEKTRPDKENDRVRHLLDAVGPRRAGLPDLPGRPPRSTRGSREVTARASRVRLRGPGRRPPHALDRPGGRRRRSSSKPSRRCRSSTSPTATTGRRRRRGPARRSAEKDPKLPPDHPVNWFPATIFPDRELAILPYNRRREGPRREVARASSSRPSAKAFRIRHGAGAEPSRRKGTSGCTSADAGTARADRARRRAGTRSARSTSRSCRTGSSPRSSASPTRARTSGSTSSAGSAGRPSWRARVDSGRAAVAFSMYPTTVAELMAIADAGAIMPPKSTWFEPKLRSGLFVHRF